MGKKASLFGALLALWAATHLSPPAATAAKVGVLLGSPSEGEALLRLEAARLRGEGRRVVEFLARPSRGSPPAGGRWAQALLRDPGVVLLIVADSPAVARAALEEARPSGAPLLSCAPGDLDELEMEDPLLFQVAPGLASAAERILGYFGRGGRERVALVAPPDSYGAKGGELLSALAPAHGVSVLLDARHSDRGRTLSELFRVARDRGAQAVIYWDREAPGRRALGTYRDLGIRLPLALGPSFARPPWLDDARSAPEGALVPVAAFWAGQLLPAGHPQRRAVEAFRGRFERSLRRPPSLAEGCLSDALALAAEALSRGEGREGVHRALLGLEGFQGVTGRFRFSESGRRGPGAEAFIMLRVRAGKVEIAP